MQFSIHRFESVSSTNDLAARMASDGAPEGAVVIAREQTAGRGRLGRRWSSSPGGLYLSLILRPGLPIERHQEIGYVASLAACEALRRVSGLDARIKPPNDVLIGPRKVSGILVESKQSAIIVGIGVNVSNESFPPEIAETATSIALEVGRPVTLNDVEEALLSSLRARYEHLLLDGFEPILLAWEQLREGCSDAS